VANLPERLQCAIDNGFPAESTDYTSVAVDPETESRIAQLVAEDTHNNWDLAPSRIRGE
jgi:hypothetical protein